MIEGNTRDASLSGLIQFLAGEAHKLYKVKLSTGGQTGEFYIQNGHLIHSSFNLLEGEEALVEFLSWREATYVIERLPSEFISTIKQNINLSFPESSTFVARTALLTESDVGLNTIVVASQKCGSLEWQEAVAREPLSKDDILVLGWLKQGRTLRQAAREFGFDIITATSILCRLLLTESIEVLRSGSKPETVSIVPAIVEANKSEAAKESSGEVEDSALTPAAVAGKQLIRHKTALKETQEVIGEQDDNSGFSAKRTDALPLVTIDIERLLQATFMETQFGKKALDNPALDQHIRQTLLEVESGKTLLLVVNASPRTPAAVLSTYRFCLMRGYVSSADSVIPLTADLLLGRIELDQYLLQRRRINGDELRDLNEIQRRQGIKLVDLLVRSGYLTAGDLARLKEEQKRFALK